MYVIVSMLHGYHPQSAVGPFAKRWEAENYLLERGYNVESGGLWTSHKDTMAILKVNSQLGT